MALSTSGYPPSFDIHLLAYQIITPVSLLFPRFYSFRSFALFRSWFDIYFFPLFLSAHHLILFAPTHMSAATAAATIAIRIPKRHTWLTIASTSTARQPCYRQRSAYYTATAAITLLRRTHKTHSGTSHDHHHVDLLTTMQQSGILKTTASSQHFC